MTHIPDEAVHAAKKAVSERCKKTYLTSDQMFAALAAALPHISAPCAVEVMELNWVEVSYGFIAHTAFGTYKVKADVDQFMMINSGSEFPTSYHDNHFEAKAAAQADFERRILSCVVTKPVDVAAVRRQALEEVEKGANSDIIKELKDAIAWRKLPGEGRHKATLEILERALSAIIAFSVDTSPKNSLNLSNLLRHAFISGFEAKGGTITEAINHWPDYNPEQCQAYERVVRALSAEPAQGDHIADVGKMVEAMEETRIDLVVLSGNIADAAKSSNKWEGMYDRVRSWIDRIDAALPAAPTTEAGK